jgi:ADP-heptose:LPS heptosyltransferase
MFDVTLMRWIDRTAGNLACNALALKKRLLNGAVGTKPIRKIVVMKFFGMGSIIVASPSLLALREAYPDAEIYFVSFAANKEVLEILDLTDKNFYIDPKTPQTFAASTMKVAAALAKEKIDLAIDFEFFAKFPLVLSGMANIPTNAGFYLTQEPWRRALLDVSGSYNHYFHTKDIFLSLIYLLTSQDIYYTEFERFRSRYAYPRVTPATEDVESARAVLASNGVPHGARVVVLNPNAAIDLAPEVRKWPEDRYSSLADRISREHDAHVVIIGSPSENEYCARIAAQARNPRVVSIAGQLKVRELLGLFSLVDLFVTNDSGPMHVACLVDTPIVGLFFADTPTVFAPLASRTACVVPPLYSIPMFTVYNGKDVFAGRPVSSVKNVPATTVSVETVMESVGQMLARGEERCEMTMH